ncbi:DUF2793 domain-containing protein [Kaistia dalseonensis]|uniref:DUF2793 domain-containing protein n=1 Tax=Kaistia dalseonensis TaxID=410840 RepID=A0ABU0H0U2_9HYPH|nr:DUF2793 domain-containing protein [Kaistia dalseonensis]MCX5493087.1 DUF2793 domain-containing protein [Kaistia dalseonensis]MDQ0435642.1 hypothetical protein [Kaistia dalseonensis]
MADLETPHLALPFLAAAQAQKHVTHNEALKRLDGIVQLAVEARGATTPPGAPAEGARYLLGTTPTGAWAGAGGQLAVFNDGAWWFATPETGWLAYDRAINQLVVLKPAGWTVV